MFRCIALSKLAVLTLLIFANFVDLNAQSDSIYRLAAGTRIRLTLDAELSSRVASKGDTFIATVAEPVIVREVIVVPVGSQIAGRVVRAERAGNGGRTAKLVLNFDRLIVAADSRAIDANLVSGLNGPKGSSLKYLSIIGGAAAGTAIGALSGSGRNAGIGALVGAGVGTGIAFSLKGKDVTIDKDAEFEIELKKEVVLPVIDY